MELVRDGDSVRLGMSVETLEHQPAISVQGDVYCVTWPDGVQAALQRVAEHRDELTAEVTLRSDGELLHSARLDLMSTHARQALIRSLNQRVPDGDWQRRIEAMCFMVRERYREGEPPADLREPVEARGGRWLVEPFVEQGGATVLFADGGTGKSLTALALAMTVASGRSIVGSLHGAPQPVLYLDWETSLETTRERYTAIAAGARLERLPEVYYRRMSASLVEAAGNIRRDISNLGIGFVVVDSLGAARAGEPESAEVTIKMFNAARSLGVPWLGIDHVTKSGGKGSTRPFGSTYTHNLARLTWSADKAQQEGQNGLVIELTNRKRNNGRLLSRLGFRIDFEIGAEERLSAVTFQSSRLSEVPEHVEQTGLKTRIMAELRSEPQRLAEVAKRLGKEVKVVSARASELVKEGALVKLPDDRFAMVTDPHAESIH